MNEREEIEKLDKSSQNHIKPINDLINSGGLLKKGEYIFFVELPEQNRIFYWGSRGNGYLDINE